MPENNCREVITSEETIDLIIQYNGELNRVKEMYDPVCTQSVNTKYAIMHFYYNELQTLRYSNSIFPKLYGLESIGGLEASCILRLRRQQTLSLYGSGVIIGFADTGIDYGNRLFVREDGTSRILSIWDQSDQTGTIPEDFQYGSEYENEQISQALQDSNPYSVVPERDEIGHGTAMAAVAAGNIDNASDFSGAAPLADIVMVKLKPAKQNLRDYHYINEAVPCYQENDILMAFKYLLRKAMIYNRPIVMCFGLGTNSGGHDGSSILDEYLNSLGNYNGICIITAGGNEGNAAGHFRGNFNMGAIGYGSTNQVNPSYNNVNDVTVVPYEYGNTAEQGQEKSRVIQERYIVAELNVGERERGFTMEMWSRSPFSYSVTIISPSGQSALIQGNNDRSEIINFTFEATTVYVDYHDYETRTGDSLFVFRFDSPAPGIWQLQVTDNRNIGGFFDIWLPIGSFLSANTYFLRSDPDITICDPGNSNVPITVTSYNYRTGSLWIQSSRGYSRNNSVTPDIAAPGVEISVPVRLELSGGNTGLIVAPLTAEDEITTVSARQTDRVQGVNYLNEIYSGTGMAAANTAGAAALLLEWGIVRGNRQVMSSTTIRKMFYQGAVPKGATVPNREWGWGILCVADSLRM